MRYGTQKFFAIAVGSVFGVIGMLLLFFSVIEDDYSVNTFLGAVFAVVGPATIFSRLRTISKYQNQNYAWYKKQHPDCIKGNRVYCCSCQSDQISVRGLMQQSYTREHFCRQCGTTLYYSPERV